MNCRIVEQRCIDPHMASFNNLMGRGGSFLARSFDHDLQPRLLHQGSMFSLVVLQATPSILASRALIKVEPTVPSHFDATSWRGSSQQSHADKSSSDDPSR